MSDNNMNRRDFLNIAWFGAGALVLAESAFVGLRFLSPRSVEGEFGGKFNIGLLEDYPIGSVTPLESGRFFLVRLKDGGVLAIYRRCTHLGCAVPYEPSIGQFVCPCHGSAFSLEGDVLNAPAPRPMDLFSIQIEEGQIVVDTSVSIERDKVHADSIVYG